MKITGERSQGLGDVKGQPGGKREELGTQIAHPCLKNESEQERRFGAGSCRESLDSLVLRTEAENTSWQREGKEPAETESLRMQASNRIIEVDPDVTEARWGPWLGGWVTFLLEIGSDNGRKGPKCPMMGTSLVVQWLRIHLPMQGT